LNNHDEIKIRASARALQERLTESALIMINYNSVLQSFRDELSSVDHLSDNFSFYEIIQLLQVKNTNVTMCLVDLHEDLTLFIRKIDLLKEKIDEFVTAQG